MYGDREEDGDKREEGEMKREGLGKLFMRYPFIIYTMSDFKMTLTMVWQLKLEPISMSESREPH